MTAHRPAAIALACSAACAVGALAASPALGALPTFHGGTVRLAAPSPIRTLDPASVDDPFESALARAATDALYRVTAGGAVLPELAADAPVVAGERVRVRVRTEVKRVGGRTLTAQAVLTSLMAAARERRARVFLEAFYDARGRPQITAVDAEHLELVPVRPDIDVARVLAAAPLAIATGRDRRRRPIGTGPFAARLLPTGEARLVASRTAPRGAPYLADVHATPPRDRDAALRAFELAELDASFFGESLYGGSPTRPTTGGEVTTRISVLLVPNQAHGPLRDPGLFGAVARAIDRSRLGRTGIAARDTLADGLPAPRLAAPRRPPTWPTLRIAVEAGDTATARIADAVAAMLDEAGIPARVTGTPPDRYAALVSTSGWDLKLAWVLPPHDDDRGLLLAAFAETAQMAEARALVRDGGLTDRAVEARHAPELAALVLGRYRPSFHARADLVGRQFSGGALPVLEELHYTRAALPPLTASAGAPAGEAP